MSEARRRAERAGRRAERWAAVWLALRGYRILDRRFRVRAGEIDIVATRGRTVCFIEVKQRTGEAVDPVSARSEARIIRAGEAWLAKHPDYVARDFGLRYDILIVSGRWRVVHRVDVFRGW